MISSLLIYFSGGNPIRLNHECLGLILSTSPPLSLPALIPHPFSSFTCLQSHTLVSPLSLPPSLHLSLSLFTPCQWRTYGKGGIHKDVMPVECTDTHSHAHRNTHSYTLIKQQLSGSLFSRYTSKIKSPAGENWGGREKGRRQRNKTVWDREISWITKAMQLDWLAFLPKFLTPVWHESKWRKVRETGGRICGDRGVIFFFLLSFGAGGKVNSVVIMECQTRLNKENKCETETLAEEEV